MATPTSDRPDAFMEEAAREFLREHPEAKQALELFGITEAEYRRYLEAQQPARFYTSSSTSEEG